MRALILACALLAALALAPGCSKQEPAKTAEQNQTEKAAATKRARENPVYGDQLRTLDKAKEVQEIANKQAEETRKKIEEQSK